MNLKFIKTDLHLSIRSWLRSKGTVFWTILFPILLILIFGAIFSGQDDIEYSLAVQNFDETELSGQFINIMNESTFFEITTVKNNADIVNYMQENDFKIGLQIPSDFGETIQKYYVDNNVTVNITYYTDPTEQTTGPIVQSIISGMLNEYNNIITNSHNVVGMAHESILGEEFDFIDFFVPGMIGFTIMTSMVYGSIERNTKFRKDGILRKLLTMPVTRYEWILSKMLFMMFLSFISTFVILVFGIVVWGLSIQLNIFFFIIIIATSFMFSGLGMLIGRFVRDPETADMAGGAITFPMMFLAGTFFPLDQMDPALQTIAQFLPLYYVNEALRNAVIYNDLDKTLYFMGFVVAFAVIFFSLGVIFTKWKED
jgi:ABC-2 type transport system permease protein